jgi:hypothetical protein
MSVTKIGNTVLGFGGFDSNPAMPYKDVLLELNVSLHNQTTNPSSTFSWTPLTTMRDPTIGERPSGRAGHSFEVVSVLPSVNGGLTAALVLFGGVQVRTSGDQVFLGKWAGKCVECMSIGERHQR